MITVIFEFQLNDGATDRYFDLAGQLRGELEKQEGFIEIERFESLNQKGRYLSLQSWKDEASVLAWRQNAEHQLAQKEGRESLFRSYRLRIASVVRDYTDKNSTYDAN